MKLSIALRNIPETGLELEYNEKLLWEESIKEFGLECRITEPIVAKVFVIKHEGGCLVRGTLSGKVVLPCDRCAEDAEYDIFSEFEEFEELPDNEYENDIRVEDNTFVKQSETRIYKDKREVSYLDIGGLLWEEFVLALPIKPLCRKDCKGICDECGTNLNTGTCTCDAKKTDPRLEKLKNFKIVTKNI